jgi:NADP-dependent 3-hydroxy acid dehydrogenase YdfG
MSHKLDGAVALITGASSGIGAATAEALAHEGATVVLLARRRERLDRLQAQIEGTHPGAAHAYELDVGDSVAVREMIDRIGDEFEHIDIVINSAGIGSWGPAVEADLADWHAMVDINVGGVLSVTHAALPHLTRSAEGKRGHADIVSVSSVAGRRVTGPNSNVYCATKHAVSAFSEALRQELGTRHVRVGVIEPGVVTTEMTTTGERHAPDARNPASLGFLEPEDIADAIAYMLTRPRHASINELVIRPTEQLA